MAWPSLPKLVTLLQLEPVKQDAAQATQEATLLEDVAVQFSNTYDFVSSGGPASKQFSELFDALVTHRLQHAGWRGQLRADQLLRCLQCLRLLSRDNSLRRRFVDMGVVTVVTGIFRQEAQLHFAGDIGPFQIETLTECASVIKRLAGEDWGLRALVDGGAHHVLMQLLQSTDPAVLPLVLVALIGFAAHKELYEMVAHANCLEVLLRIVQQYDLPFKRLAADLLALLARREVVVAELLLLNGLGRVVGQLQSGDAHLTQSLLRVVCYMASDLAALQDMYLVGTIPVLLSLVSCVVQLLADDPTSNYLPGPRITEMQLVCTALTRLSEDDDMAVQIRASDGVSLLGKLLLVTPLSSDSAEAKDVAKSGRDVVSLKAYVFRTLRYLFSVERNRKVFKRLFPPDLFACFIDVGHYAAALTAYSELVSRCDELSPKQKAGVLAALEDISLGRDATLRTVHGYIILEMLGKGAFGAVFKARRARGEALVALKELPLADMGIFGATDAERNAGVAHMGKEVEILSCLHHPNIVQYYESFTEGPYLYIVMELVEGTSLMDHLVSLAEKNRRMAEADIWQVLIAVSLALSYIHGDKQIVHRDLTPSNIVLGNGPDALRHSKIADFGLAKRLTSSVVAQSMVGTMPYTCPEIIQQEHYTEKADIWSLGCVLYHMMMLHAPFDGTNPLIVASKIVEGSYEAIKDPPTGPPYSRQLKQLVGLMMSVDPQRRPHISEVGALIAGPLMAQLGKLAANEQRLIKSLQVERTSRRGSAFADVASPVRSAQRKPPGSAAQEGFSSPAVTLAKGDTAGGMVTANSTGGSSAGSLNGTGSGALPAPPGSAAPATPAQRNTVSIATSRLKPVNDPMTQLLHQLHKVMWVEQLPPGLNRDHRRRCIESFRRHLFGAGSNAATLKTHLVKLMGSNNDMICDVTGRPVDFGSTPLHDAVGPLTSGGSGPGGGGGLGGTVGGAGGGDGFITYEQLHTTIESLLAEKGYYPAIAAAGSGLGETELLLEQLPPPNFNASGGVNGYPSAPFGMHGLAAAALAGVGGGTPPGPRQSNQPSSLGPLR